MASIRIGISGWSYKDWRGSFYPDDLGGIVQSCSSGCAIDRPITYDYRHEYPMGYVTFGQLIRTSPGPFVAGVFQ